MPAAGSTLPPALTALEGDLRRIAESRHHDPHTILGTHERGGQRTLLAFLPATMRAELGDGTPLERIPGSDFFFALLDPASAGRPVIRAEDAYGRSTERPSAYDFPPTLTPDDLAMFASGRHLEAWRMLGAHPANVDGIQGVRFAVWAPNAERVSVVGGFNDWDGRRLPMRVLGSSGVWELFVPGLPVNEVYKFEIRARGSDLLLKTDPFARAMEMRPANASVIVGDDAYRWQDQDWMEARRGRDWLHAPMSIYEVHLGSWQRHADGRFLSYRELAAELIPYVARLGFTHIELLPITEHPLDDSWGYQTTGYFAPTRRFGQPDDLRYFIEQCHLRGIGVLLDWVPGHFPRDAHGLARFDGTPLFEYGDPRKGEHLDWGTYIFNYDRFEVQSFLLSSACYWLEEFHFDGLRVDAVASMLYLDYARGGDFVRNRHGGNHNLEAMAFLRELNAITHSRSPGTVVIAEESTSWPMVSRPVEVGGLGFSMKWNMGWMHDTLEYFAQDPVYRQHQHHKLTFGMMYAYSENFVLPLSHDEVVHLKRSLLGRMPGDQWQRMANLRLLYAYMWTTPGKKLLFMGGEIAHPWEWDFRHALPWFLLEHREHEGVQRLIGDLNALYRHEAALNDLEFEPHGFAWLDCNDGQHSTLAFLRSSRAREHVVVALNFTPVPREHYRVGVPEPGVYRTIFNSDSEYYAGGNLGDLAVEATEGQHQGFGWSVVITLPPLAGVVLKKS